MPTCHLEGWYNQLADSRFSKVKPLSAMQPSPGSSKSSSPLHLVNSRSEMEPVKRLETKVTAPHGAIPISPLKVVVFLYDEKTSDWRVRDDGFWHRTSVQSMITRTSGQYCTNLLGMVFLTCCLLIQMGREPRSR